MAKGKSHSNREAKKPKKDKKAAPVAASDLFAKGLQSGAQPAGLGAKKKG